MRGIYSNEWSVNSVELKACCYLFLSDAGKFHVTGPSRLLIESFWVFFFFFQTNNIRSFSPLWGEKIRFTHLLPPPFTVPPLFSKTPLVAIHYDSSILSFHFEQCIFPTADSDSARIRKQRHVGGKKKTSEFISKRNDQESSVGRNDKGQTWKRTSEDRVEGKKKWQRKQKTFAHTSTRTHTHTHDPEFLQASDKVDTLPSSLMCTVVNKSPAQSYSIKL